MMEALLLYAGTRLADEIPDTGYRTSRSVWPKSGKRSSPWSKAWDQS